ncbi:hypothetical protein B6D52_00945 [Candidatus Parcubacteria bacterium 4484_255]|nr:MAG: hypothetical protein B6D52_00945 [Candidatus Parcubacteria bacterium 4484_255]
MKTQFKTLFSLITTSILLLPLLAIPNSALADGMIIMPDPHSGRWDYLSESNQQSFINYEDGLEKLQKKQNQICLILKKLYQPLKFIQFLLLIGWKWTHIEVLAKGCLALLRG